MKDGIIIKNYESSVSKEELELINKYTRRPFEEREVYVFSLVLCDNDVDRDFERFTVEALFELEKLFVGKTGIFDHNPKAENQTARIFSCRVEAVEGKKTQTGDDYFRLVARAYMPRCESTEQIIMQLESGITKEVSVGCAAKSVLCSVCGADRHSSACSHRRGEYYAGKLCHFELCEITDAYEWSFVAVPAQREAGVVKGFHIGNRKEKHNMTDIIKFLETEAEVTLSASDAKALAKHIETLGLKAKQGDEYRQELVDEVLRLSVVAQPAISRKTMENAVKALSVSELREFMAAYKDKSEKSLMPKLQLMPTKAQNLNKGNKEFKI